MSLQVRIFNNDGEFRRPGIRRNRLGEPIFKASARGNAFGWLVLGGVFVGLSVATSYPSFDSPYSAMIYSSAGCS